MAFGQSRSRRTPGHVRTPAPALAQHCPRAVVTPERAGSCSSSAGIRAAPAGRRTHPGSCRGSHSSKVEWPNGGRGGWPSPPSLRNYYPKPRGEQSPLASEIRREDPSQSEGRVGRDIPTAVLSVSNLLLNPTESPPTGRGDWPFQSPTGAGGSRGEQPGSPVLHGGPGTPDSQGFERQSWCSPRWDIRQRGRENTQREDGGLHRAEGSGACKCLSKTSHVSNSDERFITFYSQRKHMLPERSMKCTDSHVAV